MLKNQGPYTRAAWRMLRAFLPTLLVWLVAVMVWAWWTVDDGVWLAIGWAGLTLPYLAAYYLAYRRFRNEVE